MTALSRTPVLPRELASAITVTAVARGTWALGAASLVISMPLSLGLFLRTDSVRSWSLPAAALVTMVGFIALVALHTRLWTMLAFLVGGAVLSYAYVFSILSLHPQFQLDAIYTINRPATVLVLAGVVSSKPLSGIRWSAVGLLFGLSAMLLAEWQLGLPLVTGAGPVIAFVNNASIYAAIALIQRAQLGRVPDFARSLAETTRLRERRKAKERAIALVHDTVLNGLAIVMTAPDRLSLAARDRLAADLETLRSRGGAASATPRTLADDDATTLENEFRNKLLALLTRTRWSGLTVDTQLGQGPRIVLQPHVADAVIGAIGAALENVASHSGTKSAQLEFVFDNGHATFIIADAGVGFDPTAIDPERLGVRVSVIGRIEAVGGSAKVWSTPGGGTSVIISVPAVGGRS